MSWAITPWAISTVVERTSIRAVEQYRAALEINPSYLYAWNGLGMTLGSLKDDSGALEAFRQAVNVAPQSPLPYLNLAVQLERMGKIDEAYQEFCLPDGPISRAVDLSASWVGKSWLDRASERLPGRRPDHALRLSALASGTV